MNPFRSEVIGSLLRPDYLKQATLRFEAGQTAAEELSHIQEKAILDAIALQEACGISVITDGEMRRRGWTAPLTESIDGYGDAPVPAGYRVNWHGYSGGEGQRQTPVWIAVIRKLKRGRINLPLREMEFLSSHTSRPFKVTLPSLAHASVLWAPGISDLAYPEKEDYLHDALELTSEIVAECVGHGAKYVQLDSPRYTHLVSEEGQDNFRRLGIDPQKWLEESIRTDNSLIDRFPNVLWGLHLCRGNGPRGSWAVAGGYDPIAERLFNEIHVNRLLLEYDTPRAGSFEPLRFVPKEKVAVLGLISTKDREVETPELLKRRVEEASRYIDPDRIALSPQCGFASAFEGNLDEEIQRQKLETLGKVAEEIWG